MTLPAFPVVSPDPVIAASYIGDLALTLVGADDSDPYDVYSISDIFNSSPTNQWVVDNRIPAVNSPADGYVFGETFVMPESALPAQGQTLSFYIYAYRFSGGGGDQQYYYASSFTITRSAPLVLPTFPSISPDPSIAYNFNSTLDLFMSPVAGDGLDAYSISKFYNASPTNQFVSDNRIAALNTPANGYVTGSLFQMPASELPQVQGSAITYYIYAYRFPSGGGEGQYYYSSSFQILRSTETTSPGNNTHGLQVAGPNGAIVFSPNFKVSNLAILTAFSIPAGGFQDFACDSAQFANKVATIVDTGSRLSNQRITVTRQTNNIRLTNTHSSAIAGQLVAIRIA